MARITDEQWTEIRATLESWSEEQLIKALTNHKFAEAYRRAFEQAQQAEQAEAKRLQGLTKQSLIQQALNLVRENNIFTAWVDCGGYSQVEFGNTRNSDTSPSGDNDDYRK